MRLGSKLGYSANLGVAELVELVEAFERHNSVSIGIRSYLTTAGGKRDLQWVASAYDGKEGSPGRKVLAYASVRCLEKRLLSMEAVLLHLLYMLDFQLAEHEMTGGGDLKA